MGYTYSAGLAEAAAEGAIDRRTALVAHLQGGFYPPLPAAYAGVADAALDAAAFGDWDLVIPLPYGLNMLPADRFLRETDIGEVGITAQTAIEILQLHPFVESWDA